MNRFRLLILTGAHFCVDSYATMLVPALPFLSEQMGFGLAFSGVLATVPSVCNVSQPLLGLWADRMARRYLIVAGLLLAAVFMPLIGIATSYVTLVVLLCLGASGVAAFHPQSFAVAGALSGNRRSFGIAIYVFGGTLALGATPIWVSWFGSGPGMQYLPLATIPGLILLLAMVKVVPFDNPQVAESSTSVLQSLRHLGWPVILITVVVILRSVSGLGVGTFIVFLGRERGLSAMESGAALSAYNTAGVVASLLFGYLADYFRPKVLTWGTILAACPLLLGYVHTGGILSYVLLVAGGAMLLASNSIMVAMAQELAPRNEALASSLPLGFSWGTASLALGPLGFLADRIGLEAMLTGVATLPVLTAVLAMLLPSTRPPAASTSQEPEQ
jgi:MFS transporter, FSR family, fosmidomycin resistance protein